MADIKEKDLPKITTRSDIKEVRLVKTDGTSTSMEISTFIKEIALEIARSENFASVVAELIGIETTGSLTIPAKGSIEIHTGRGFMMFDADAGAQTMICGFSYWSSQVIANIGAGLISIAHSSIGQHVIITNLKDSECYVIYKRLIV